ELLLLDLLVQIQRLPFELGPPGAADLYAGERIERVGPPREHVHFEPALLALELPLLAQRHQARLAANHEIAIGVALARPAIDPVDDRDLRLLARLVEVLVG